MNHESSKWVPGSFRGVVEIHISDYETYFDALYEYTKNLEEASAHIIRMEFSYDENRILVYGDGEGLDAEGLKKLKDDSIGKSGKGVTHHGVGILAFMRFAKRMVMFSKKNGIVYVLSCVGNNEDIVSDTGDVRPIGHEEEQIYRNVLYKLEKWPEGTITVFEGVGKYKSDKYNYQFDMNKEFEAKKFERWFRDKLGFSLRSRSYFIKYGNDSPKRIEGKVAHGKKLSFKLPSKEYPLESIPGTSKNSFEQNGRYFTLELTGEIYVSPANDATIRISENHKDSLDIRDAFKSNKLTYSTVYKNPEYLKLLSGLIDFKIRPTDGGESLSVYPGSRRILLTEGPFGDCLANMLNFADREIIRPVVAAYLESNVSRKDEIRSRELQNDLDAFFRDCPVTFEDTIHTKNEDAVSDRNYVPCRGCGTSSIPKRGLFADLDIKTGSIYAPDDKQIYLCGTCGREWPRRSFTPRVNNSNEGPGLSGGPKPMYDRYSGGGLVPRKQKRGFGFSVQVQAFQKSDNDRRGQLVGTIVKVNRTHSDYKTIESIKNRDALGIYERHVALDTIVRYEMRDNNNKDAYGKKLADVLAQMLTWYYTGRKRMNKAEVEEAREKDAVVGGVQDLGAAWGAKVKKEKKTAVPV